MFFAILIRQIPFRPPFVSHIFHPPSGASDKKRIPLFSLLLLPLPRWLFLQSWWEEERRREEGHLKGSSRKSGREKSFPFEAPPLGTERTNVQRRGEIFFGGKREREKTFSLGLKVGPSSLSRSRYEDPPTPPPPPLCVCGKRMSGGRGGGRPRTTDLAFQLLHAQKLGSLYSRSWLRERYGKVEEGKRHWMMLRVCVSAFPQFLFICFFLFFVGGWGGRKSSSGNCLLIPFFDAFNISGI